MKTIGCSLITTMLTQNAVRKLLCVRAWGVVPLALCFTLCACSTPLGPLPHLPRKDWLEEKTTPAANDASISFYSPDKVLTFSDLVYLAVQQSPILAKSSVNMDIQKINVADARWKALPEVHLLAVISNNITRYNQSMADTANAEAARRGTRSAFKDYGELAYQISFSGVFNNPVATYFDIKAQNELMDIAIEKHREAIGDCIYNIAQLLIKMHTQHAILNILQKNLVTAKKNRDYNEISEKFSGNIWETTDTATDSVRDIELQIDAAEIEMVTLRNQLKRLLGLDRTQKLQVDFESLAPFLKKFSPDSNSWEQYWQKSTKRRMLAGEIRLHNAGIMLAWAQYVPTISFVVNESPPRGQAQPVNAETDQFLHVTLNFPILDWGYRYRQGAKARERKRQSRLDEIMQREAYRDEWFNIEERLTLCNARLNQREHAVESARKRYKLAEAHWKSGTIMMHDYLRAQQALSAAQIEAQKAKSDKQIVLLEWMRISQIFQHHFLETSTSGKTR